MFSKTNFTIKKWKESQACPYAALFLFHFSATNYNNLRKPLTNSSNSIADPHEMGVGEINPLRALNPGLVFETDVEDYLRFLCYFGYSQKIIRSMSKTNFNCPKNSSEGLISNVNYPSISISTLKSNPPTFGNKWKSWSLATLTL